MLDNTDPLDAASVPTPRSSRTSSRWTPRDRAAAVADRGDETDNFAIEVRHVVWREAGDADWQTNSLSWLEGDRFYYDFDRRTGGRCRSNTP
jgi:hypothetical protein